MRKIIIAFAALLTATPAFASDQTDVAATIKQYNDDFSKGDAKAAAALCTDDAVIIDDFAPHLWQGASACMAWSDGLAASSKTDGLTDEVVTLVKQLHVSVTGDRGYAVYATTYGYKAKGKPVLENGVWTFAMRKTAKGWRIAGWAWAQH